MYSPNRGHVQPLNRDGRGDNTVDECWNGSKSRLDAGTIIIKAEFKVDIKYFVLWCNGHVSLAWDDPE